MIPRSKSCTGSLRGDNSKPTGTRLGGMMQQRRLSMEQSATMKMMRRLSPLGSSSSTTATTTTTTTTTACSSDDDSQRSGSARGARVRQVQEPLESCMKVKTLEQSLCGRTNGSSRRRQTNKNKKTNGRRASWGDSLLRVKESSGRFLAKMIGEAGGSDERPDEERRLGSLRRVKSYSHVLSSSGTTTLQLSKEEVDEPNMPSPSTTPRPSMRESLKKTKSFPASVTRASNTGSSRRSLFGSRRNLNTSSLRNLFRRNDREEDTSGDSEEDAGTHVRYGDVEVREYGSVVCAHPGVSRGPAVTLGWGYDTAVRCPLEHYESARAPRKEMKEMRLTKAEREARLLASGVSRAELQLAVKGSNLAKQKRRRTIQRLENSSLEERSEKLEGAKRKFKKMIRMKKSHEKEEEDLWANAQSYFSQ